MSTDALRRPAVTWVTMVIAVVAFATFLGVGLLAVAHVIPWAVSIPLQALAAYAGFTPMHEAAHGTVARVRWLNESIGWLSGVPILAAFAGFRALHNAHHAFTNDPARDPNMWSTKGKTWLGIGLRWTVKDLHYTLRYLRGAARRPRGEVAGSAAFISALWLGWVALSTMDRGGGLLLAWLLPSRIAITLLSIGTLGDGDPHGARGGAPPQRQRQLPHLVVTRCRGARLRCA